MCDESLEGSKIRPDAMLKGPSGHELGVRRIQGADGDAPPPRRRHTRAVDVESVRYARRPHREPRPRRHEGRTAPVGLARCRGRRRQPDAADLPAPQGTGGDRAAAALHRHGSGSRLPVHGAREGDLGRPCRPRCRDRAAQRRRPLQSPVEFIGGRPRRVRRRRSPGDDVLGSSWMPRRTRPRPWI